MWNQTDRSPAPIDWLRTWRRVAGPVVFVLAILGAVLLFDWLGRPPQTQAAAEDQLDRPVMAFASWDGTPYVVFKFGDAERVYFDRLRIDWISVEWPPAPRWQWTGFDWSYLDATTAPASAGLATTLHGTAVFGQLNDLTIVAIELEIDGTWRRFPVSGDGYAVRLAGFDVTPTGYRWVDAEGRVIFAADEPSSVGP